ncbi:MAG: polysaccharide lyase [Phycisphaerae bacterium]|jgi:PelA/Pel-15E family pectate lyase
MFRRSRKVCRVLPVLPWVFGVCLAGEEPPSESSALRGQAAAALRRGVAFFREAVAVEGGYLWQYSADLSRREGEEKAPRTRVWVQPPGTPSVGMAFLAAYAATQDRYYLEAVKDTAHCLVRGQLHSGGWGYSIDFDEAARKAAAYREGGAPAGRDVTTLDDDTTQSAVRFLMHADRALGFKDAKVHEAVVYAWNRLLEAQFPNGAWPQRFTRPPAAEDYPVRKASYPDQWPRTFPNVDYKLFYTLNDNVMADMIDTLFEAGRIYGASDAPAGTAELAAKCRSAAERAGDFLLLAQMPEPQPGWAQQYDVQMHPVWARRFEPPAVSGGEARGVLRTLLRMYRETGEGKYLEPIPKALAYYRRSRLPDGRLARFYELGTNRPLYFTKDYRLTYDDSDVPTHYGFKVDDWTGPIAAEYERARAWSPEDLKRRAAERGINRRDGRSDNRARAELESAVRSIIDAQDERGRWVEDGSLRAQGPGDDTRRVIRCATFIHNVQTLSRYLGGRAD